MAQAPVVGYQQTFLTSVGLPKDTFPEAVKRYPKIRYMGSKARLLPWIHEVLSEYSFETALDAFSGSGSVSYLLKAMGKAVTSNDFLNFASVLTAALVQNNKTRLDPETLDSLLCYDRSQKHFIEQTFRDIFFSPTDLRFLDRVSWNLNAVRNPNEKALALSALIRSCVKRQPRGVFTVAGDPEKHKDGRRDLKLSIEEHFLEQVQVYNEAVFDNRCQNRSVRGDVFDLDGKYDLVYMDPPYVPRSDDNCYMKRYHFLEGLSCYWKDQKILPETRVKKISKPYTPFSYRKDCLEAFDNLFSSFRESILVLSYSSNGFPDLATLRTIMGRYKDRVDVYERDHRYHFGTHSAVKRAEVKEFLIVGE